VGDYSKLAVWKRAHELTLAVYHATAAFPVPERYGLSAQLRQAAVSVPSNIAEGCGRDSDSEMKRFAIIALGSANELQYQLLLGRDLGYLDRHAWDSLAGEARGVRSMLASLVSTLQRPKSSRKSRQPTAVS
jgi:four helix bundle protein